MSGTISRCQREAGGSIPLTRSKIMKTICVFLSASDLPEKYTKPAEKLGRLFAKNNYGFMYGGSHLGLMKVMSSAVKKAGGKVIGISTELFKHVRWLDADEMIVTKDLLKRKQIMSERSDATVVMVGGLGTLDEFSELMALKKYGKYDKPIIFLNTDNFYAGLKALLRRMEKEKFNKGKLGDMVLFADTPSQVIKILANTLGDK